MIKIGMLIADRYEILEKVGTGGMADVYKSKDHTLNRYVAVKVLKQEFSENANFVSKFRVEAQAAAGLMHPNIVNVYDVGEEKGIYYIVMELVDGITLKNYIGKKGNLGYKEAVTIALQVSMGLEAAHRNHIIHRDIKPGESTVAIAIRHIQEPMPSPRKLNPDIPYSVEQIVLKCCEKSPDRRYQNMQELASDLKKSISDPDGDFVKRYNPNDMGTTRMLTEEEKRQIKESTKSAETEKPVSLPDEEDDDVKRVVKPVRHSREDDLFDEEEDYDEEERENSMDRIARILAVLAVVIIGAILALIIGGRTGLLPIGGGGQNAVVAASNEMVVMPNVIGIDVAAARSALVKQGLIPELTYEESDKYTVGIVMESSVKEGTEIPVGTTVVLTVCGNSGSIIPDVIGLLREEAVDMLTEAGFNVNIMEVTSEDVEEGIVVGQDPAGETQAEEGTYVRTEDLSFLRMWSPAL